MSSGVHDFEETAVPTLKVMRLQSPDLGQPTAGSLESRFVMESAMSLPDSFGVIHVGETFTAYLGAVNVSATLMVRRLTVSAQLQTPSHRYPLPSSLDGTLGMDVPPGDGVDAIVSRALEESGQHILRVEVGYQTSEGSQKTLRKFYRFHVSSPIQIKERTVRTGDSSCLVSIAVENISAHAMVISQATFETVPGLESTSLDKESKTNDTPSPRRSAAQMLDHCGRLEPKSSVRFLFSVSSNHQEKEGIACGDRLGQAVLEWKKTMGESGRIVSGPITCPPVQPPGLSEQNPTKIMMGSSDYVVYKSGLSVDVAAASVGSAPQSLLHSWLPVTVEPMDPLASTMTLGKPIQVVLLVVNHFGASKNLQLQFRLNHMSGVAICGKSFCNLGELPGNGGSKVVQVGFLPLVAGLLRVQGCCVVELDTGKEIPQPPLFHVLVETPSEQ